MTADPPAGHRLRLMPAPPTDPPYDDELDAAAIVTDGALALAFPLPAPPVPLRLAPPAIEEESDERATPRALLPDPGVFAHRFAQAVVEVLGADRPASQLSRHATLDVLDQLERTIRRRARGMVPPTALIGLVRSQLEGVTAGPGSPSASRPRAISVHVSEPAEGVAEACAVITVGPRRRALAFRLEGRDGRWQCTALRMG